MSTEESGGAAMSVGEALAEARRRAGLTVAQVSQETRIREAIIRDIEQGDFASSGGDFYARGHIRSIARAVGADPALLVQAYDDEHGPPHAIRASEVFEPSAPIKIRERRRGPGLGTIVILVLLAVIGYSAYHLVSARGSGSRHPAVAASTRPAARASTKPAPTARASATAPATHPPSDVVIKLTANQDCWVLITRQSDGSQLYMGVVPAGTTMTWTEKQAVSVRLGNPPGVVLTVNGKTQPTASDFSPVTLSFSPGSAAGSS
jgi:cytoskeletal protein RodZ